MIPTTITCAECGGHDFTLDINDDDGSTSLRCVYHTQHRAARQATRSGRRATEPDLTQKEALLRLGAKTIDSLDPQERAIFDMNDRPYLPRVMAIEALRRADRAPGAPKLT